MSKPILCLDFDGVIHSYSSGWQGAHIVNDPPVPGAIEFMGEASKHFTLAIYSSRSGQPGGLKAMQGWLYNEVRNYRNYPNTALNSFIDISWFDRISWPTEKPAAFLTIDDRALTFTGAWPRIKDLLDFQPWNKADRDGKVRHTRAVLNVDAPRYLDLERRYYAALKLLMTCEVIPGDKFEKARTDLLNEAAAKHPIRLTVEQRSTDPVLGQMVTDFELLGTS